MKFRLSRQGGPLISAEEAMTRTYGIVGQRGTGKSSGATVMVERFIAAKGRAVIADPTGVWWGLAHAGTGPGISGTIILGGEHANAPLEETGGELVADLVVNADYSAIVLDLKLLRKAQQTRFMADFMEALYHHNRDALHVVIDEAGRFCPQNPREKGHLIRLIGAIEDVVKLGRSRGLGCSLIEQRPAHINKSVFEQVETLISFRLVGPNDRKAISAWIQEQGDPEREREIKKTIAKLKTGRGLVYSPAFLECLEILDFARPTTYDSKRTPKAGQRRRRIGQRAPVDLDDLSQRMADTIERAKDRDPKHLRARIAELERQLAERPVTAPPPPKIVKTPALSARQKALLERFCTAVDRVSTVRSDIATLLSHFAANGSAKLLPATPRPPAPRIPAETPARPRPASTSKVVDGVAIRTGARRMLQALATMNRALTRQQVAMLAGLSKSGTFDAYLRDLKRAGFVQARGTDLEVTVSGVDYLAGDFGDTPKDLGAVADLFRSSLRTGACRMLDVLLSAPEIEHDREQLADAANLTKSGTFDAYLRDLKRSGLVVASRSGIRINPDLIAVAR